MNDNLTHLDVEVHCLQPGWAAHELSKYRLYLNDELLTERDWIWPLDTYIKENIIVEIPRRQSHNLRIEVIKLDPKHLTKLTLKNFTVNGVSQNTDCDTLSFMLE